MNTPERMFEDYLLGKWDKSKKCDDLKKTYKSCEYCGRDMTRVCMCQINKNDNQDFLNMKIELKTTSLKEILQVCKNNNIDINKAKIDTKIWSDFSTVEDYVKIYLKYSKKKFINMRNSVVLV